MLKPLDIVAGLKAHLWGNAAAWSYERLAAAIGVSPSQVHASLRRLEQAGLYRSADRSLRAHAFTMFAAHGIPFVFPAELGGLVVGMPTAHSAAPLRAHLASAEAYVWPDEAGIVGRPVLPIHPCVPKAAATDADLYAALALIDALRVGRVRDRLLAIDGLTQLLAQPARDLHWLAVQRVAGQAT